MILRKGRECASIRAWKADPPGAEMSETSNRPLFLISLPQLSRAGSDHGERLVPDPISTKTNTIGSQTSNTESLIMYQSVQDSLETIRHLFSITYWIV